MNDLPRIYPPRFLRSEIVIQEELQCAIQCQGCSNLDCSGMRVKITVFAWRAHP